MPIIPSGREWIREEPPATGTEGHWDHPGRVLLLGILLPLALLIWIIVDLVNGYVWLGGGGGRGEAFHRDRESLVFWGVLLVKLCGAGIAFTVWTIGNHPQWGWHTEKIVLILCIATAAGVVMSVVGAAW